MEPTEDVTHAAGAKSALNYGLAVMLELMERAAFEKWYGENNGIPTRLKGTDQYIMPVVQGAWMAWKARAAHTKPCRGIAHHGCNYLAACGSICNKCGQAI